jgi:hypothetical protein
MDVFLGYILSQGQGMAGYRRYQLDLSQRNHPVPFWFSVLYEGESFKNHEEVIFKKGDEEFTHLHSKIDPLVQNY